MNESHTVSTASSLYAGEIWRFTVARRPIVTCFRRVAVDLAGVCTGKLEIAACFVRQRNIRGSFFWTREARYDFRFSLANASENDHNVPDHGASVKRLEPFPSVSPAVARCAISIGNRILSSPLWFLLSGEAEIATSVAIWASLLPVETC